MKFHRDCLNRMTQNQMLSIKPLYVTRHIGKTQSINQGLKMRAITAELYRGNQARIINLKTKHDTNVYSVRITRRQPTNSPN